MALPSLEETSSFPQSSFPPSETSPRFMMMDALIERPRKWQQDGGRTDGQTVDESIHRSEGGYGWGKGSNEGTTFALFDGRNEERLFLQTSLLSPSSLLPLTRSVSLWLLKQKHVPLPSSPSSAIMSLMSWRAKRGTQWSISPSCLKGTSSSILPSSLLFLSTSNAAQKPFLAAYRTTSYPSHLLVLRGAISTSPPQPRICPCHQVRGGGDVDVVRRQTDEQRSAANAMR